MLTKAGFRSTRNAAKPWRHPRVVVVNGQVQPHPIDMMKWWIPRDGLGQYRTDENGNYEVKRANTTGCVGTFNMDSATRDIESTVITKGLSGRPRRTRPKKGSGGVAAPIGHAEDTRIEHLRFHRWLSRWNRLFNRLVVHGDLSYEQHLEYQQLKAKIVQWAGPRAWELIYQKAQRRRLAMLGRVAKGQIPTVTI